MFNFKDVFNKQKIVETNRLFSLFMSKKDDQEFPKRIALLNFEALRSSTSSQDELISFLLEDVIFLSLYATFYEEIFNTIYENPQYTKALIEKFESHGDERENAIALIAEQHIEYILNNGKCKGCSSCEHHHDVDDLIVYWQNKDYSFLASLYIGMQTIKVFMENLLGDELYERPELSKYVSKESILKVRQDIYSYIEKHI